MRVSRLPSAVSARLLPLPPAPRRLLWSASRSALTGGGRIAHCATSRIAHCAGVRHLSTTNNPSEPILPPQEVVLPDAIARVPKWGSSQFYAATQRWEAGRAARVAAFGSGKQWKTLSLAEAQEQYCVRRRDLDSVPFVSKYNVHGLHRITRFYHLSDVQDASLRRWGTLEALEEALAARRAKRERRVARRAPPVLLFLRPVRRRKGQVVVGRRAVQAAMLGNLGVAGAKLSAWATTGSAALLAEAIHSLADLGNQILLAYGLQQSLRAADDTRPYGYGLEQYVWTMVSGVSMFILGAGATVSHGFHALYHPEPLASVPVALGVLGAAGLLEGYTLSVAWAEVKAEAAKLGMSAADYLRHGPDPLNPAVLLEDSVAVVGVGVAAAGIGLTALTGNPAFDAAGSIAVGGMLGCVAVFIIHRARAGLGQAVPLRTAGVVRLLESDELVLSVQDVKSVMVGPQTARFKAELIFNPQLLTSRYLAAHDNLSAITASCQAVKTEAEARQIFERYGVFFLATLSVEIDRLEHMIQAAYPEFAYIDIEVL